MKRFLFIIAILSIFLIKNKVAAQGCSDAGFCSVGSLQPMAVVDSFYRHQLQATISYGSGEQGVSVLQFIPEWQWRFSKNLSIQVKVPYVYANGNLGSNSGVGDATLAFSGEVVNRKDVKVNASIGIKAPSGSTDASGDKSFPLVLPMPYQTGLGTTDLILGSSVSFFNWNAGIGFQGVLKNENKNTFAHFRYINEPDADKYFESNMLSRGNDVLIRIERIFASNKWTFSPGVLAIYRLMEDEIVTAEKNVVAIKGSDGLTLNITGMVTHEISSRITSTLVLGAPVIIRENRPDGLTRSFVFNLGIQYNFGAKNNSH
jgi:hypothetical protein